MNKTVVVVAVLVIVLGYIFLCGDSRRIEVVNSLPDQGLEYVGSFLWSEPQGLSVHGEMCAVAYVNGLVLVDVSDPRNPTITSRAYAQSGAFDVDLRDDVAYLACGGSGVRVFSVADPSTPVQIESWAPADSDAFVVVVGAFGDLVFAADSASGARLAVARSKASLLDSYGGNGRPITTIPEGARAQIIREEGEWYGVVCRQVAGWVKKEWVELVSFPTGITVLDASNSRDLSMLSFFQTPARVRALDFDDGFLFAALGDSGVQIISVSNPDSPVVVGRWKRPGFAYDVAVSDDIMYVAGRHTGVQIVDVSDPANPTTLMPYDLPGRTFAVAADGDYAYYCDDDSGFGVVELVDDPAKGRFPDPMGSAAISRLCRDLEVSNGYAYVLDAEDGLVVVDARSPNRPVAMGRIGTQGRIANVMAGGGRAYAFGPSLGFAVYDVTEPTDAEPVSRVEPPSTRFGIKSDMWGMWAVGNTAFVAGGMAGLQAYDISDIESPRFISRYVTPYQVVAVEVSGGIAYAADGDSGMQIISVADPTDMRHIGMFDTWGTAFDVDYADGFCYVPSGRWGVHVIDVSDPSVPDTTRLIETEGNTWTVFVTDGKLYVADDYMGLGIYDLSDPAYPRRIGEYARLGFSQDVFVSDGYAYTADGELGVQVLDVRDPDSPELVGSYDTPFFARRIWVADDLVYVADEASVIVLRPSWR
jgi:hypothetical protein